ncbi:MAG: ABC transporter ATP-binding protein, partial [Streptomycetaceae bacterium]
MARNVVNIEEVSKTFDITELLIAVSLGGSEGARIGIVGRNGSCKSTLMKVMAGVEAPDSGRVTKSKSAGIGNLSQVYFENPESTVGEVVLG